MGPGVTNGMVLGAMKKSGIQGGAVMVGGCTFVGIPGRSSSMLLCEAESSIVVIEVTLFITHPMLLSPAFVLGGGLGFLGRIFGLACDSLVSLEMVLADGSIVQVDEREYGQW